MHQETNAQSPFKSLLMTSLGGCFEFYDFIIFVLFGPYFSQVIFPAEAENSIIPLLQVYAVFAVGYIARPIGGIFISHLGDQYGRRKAMILSVCIMSTCTLMMGLLPGYAHIGIWAPVLFSTFRILQGIALGGELPGCITYISEMLPQARGISCAIVFGIVGLSVSLGAFNEWLIASLLSEQAVYDFGWRIPFILGFFLGAVTLIIRLKSQETLNFRAKKKEKRKAHGRSDLPPIVFILRFFPLQAIGGGLITGYVASLVSLVYLVMNAYLLDLGYQDTHIASALSINMLITSILYIFWGYFSDKINFRKVLVLSILVFWVVLPVIYQRIIDHQGILLCNLLTLAVFNSIGWATIPKTLAEIFPTEARFSGVALSYNLGFATLGGLAPVTVTYFMAELNSPFVPVWYLWGASVFCLIGLLMIYIGNKQLGIHDHIANELEQKNAR